MIEERFVTQPECFHCHISLRENLIENHCNDNKNFTRSTLTFGTDDYLMHDLKKAAPDCGINLNRLNILSIKINGLAGIKIID